MPRIAKPKVELKNTLPADPAERNRLKKIIQEGVDAKMAAKDAAQTLKDVITVEKETYQYEPKFIRTLINTEFDYQYQAQKKRKQLEDQVEQMNESDILMGRSQPNAVQAEEDDGQEDQPDESEE